MKLVAIVFATALIVVSVAGARPSGGPEPFASNGSFTVCVDVAFPPLEYFAKPGSTTPVGFDIDYAKAVARHWGLKIKFSNTAFSGLLPALAANKCDLVWSGIFVTPDRTKAFPAVGYMRTHRVLLVKAGNPERITNPNQLSGKVVATQTGTKYVDALKALDKQLRAAGRPGLKIQTYPKATDATAALLVGRVAAVLTQDTEAAFRMTQTKGRFQIAYTYGAFDTFGVYYRRGDAAVGPALKAAFAKLKANGTVKRIAVKHNLPLKSFGLK